MSISYRGFPPWQTQFPLASMVLKPVSMSSRSE